MYNTENLADPKNINSKILADGEILPFLDLKDGTVAAMLHNIKLYNSGERGLIETELEAAIPTLIKIGFFDLFPPEEWIETNNEGRRFVGQATLKYMSKRKKGVFPRLFCI